MCSANPSHCVSQENHGTMWSWAERRPGVTPLMCSSIIQRWCSFLPQLSSHAHCSSPVWPHLYAHMTAPPDSSLDVQRMLWNNSSFWVASCVNNATTITLYVFPRVWIGCLCKASYVETYQPCAESVTQRLHIHLQREERFTCISGVAKEGGQSAALQPSCLLMGRGCSPDCIHWVIFFLVTQDPKHAWQHICAPGSCSLLNGSADFPEDKRNHSRLKIKVITDALTWIIRRGVSGFLQYNWGWELPTEDPV